MRSILVPTLALSILCFGCQSTAENKAVIAEETSTLTPAESTLQKALLAHGGTKYDSAHYQFVFREKQYTFKNSGRSYRYTVTSEVDGKTIKDVLDNGQFTRRYDDQIAELTEKDNRKYADALNSVIYFATLPHKLKDPAVNLVNAASFTIKGQSYQSFKVHFDREGGGTDFDDNFQYWVNLETGRIDYLAYDYRVNKGGVRFRSAYNPRVVDGILFQDYINFKAPLGTPLSDLPSLYQNGALEELSRIETEAILSLD